MDFARKQLEKYGWTAGKGLGKNENGISEALKPKLKRSMTGVGHDLASDFTEHWWNDLYNKAAKNVEVEEVNGKVKKIKSKEATFEITNNTWQIKKKKKGDSPNGQYTNYFVKTAILSDGTTRIDNINTSELEEKQIAMDSVKMTDEELFAACGGRTAHKGARHGLKALGKLARIEQQEQMLLNEAKYNGYSSKGKQNTKIENENTNSQENSCNNYCDIGQDVPKKKKKKHSYDEICSKNTSTICIDQVSNISDDRKPKLSKKKKDKRKNNNNLQFLNDVSKDMENNSPKKKKHVTCAANILHETDDLKKDNDREIKGLKKKKNDKRNHDLKLFVESNINIEVEKNVSKEITVLQVESNSEINEENSNNISSKKKKKKKKHCKNM